MENSQQSDNRSSDFVLVPFCTLSQAFHAKGLVKYEWGGSIKPIVQLLIESDVNIIQMPCIETFFFGVEKGLNREPAGRKKYDTEEFRTFCETKAEETFATIKGIVENGYTVKAVLGMEYSPSCAVKMQYPPRPGGNQGFYIESLQKKVEDAGYDIPFLGINRRAINPTLKRLTDLLQGEKQIALNL